MIRTSLVFAVVAAGIGGYFNRGQPFNVFASALGHWAEVGGVAGFCAALFRARF